VSGGLVGSRSSSHSNKEDGTDDYLIDVTEVDVNKVVIQGPALLRAHPGIVEVAAVSGISRSGAVDVPRRCSGLQRVAAGGVTPGGLA
jgi:hypothetical protein